MKPICYAGLAASASAAAALYHVVLNLIPRSVLYGVSIVVFTAFAVTLSIAISAGSSAQTLSKDFPLQFRLAAQFRTPMLMFVVVPLSFLRVAHTEIAEFFRHSNFFASSRKIDEGHAARVENIVRQVKEWNTNGREKRLRTARPNWASMSTKLSSNKSECSQITMSSMSHILDIDEENMTITAEPGVNMGQITHYLVPRGYALLIQVEMEHITIGGVSMGFGMETNSHIVGFFQESVVAYELVSSTGEVLRATEKSDPELFFALPWSCGTLGFLTSVTVRIRKIKPYIRVRYLATRSAEELGSKMKELSESPNAPSFLEATIYTKDEAVIQMGEFVEVETAEDRKKVNSINLWFKPFYYKWVETFLKKDEKDCEEIIPLMDYYHRFTRSIFWELEEMIPFSNHWLYRTLWGWMGPPEVALLKLFQGPVIRKASVYAHVVQESIMPVSYLKEGIERFDKWYGVYPLLVFPLRVYDRGELSGFLHPEQRNLVPGKNWGIWVDLGAYGAPRAVKEGKKWDAKTNIREMEHWTREIGGWQAYYTDLFCTKEEFKQMFDHSLVDKCRKRMMADDAFPEIFDKVRPEAGIIEGELCDEKMAAESRETHTAQKAADAAIKAANAAAKQGLPSQ